MADKKIYPRLPSQQDVHREAPPPPYYAFAKVSKPHRPAPCPPTARSQIKRRAPPPPYNPSAT